jgi:hypothetical protein
VLCVHRVWSKYVRSMYQSLSLVAVGIHMPE